MAVLFSAFHQIICTHLFFFSFFFLSEPIAATLKSPVSVFSVKALPLDSPTMYQLLWRGYKVTAPTQYTDLQIPLSSAIIPRCSPALKFIGALFWLIIL